jgi:ABC-type phosphate/phosphonate transport system substrate-binding protein
VRPGLSEETAQEIEDAMLAAIRSDENIEIFDEIYNWEDMEPSEDSDYDVIREAAEALDLDIVELAEE